MLAFCLVAEPAPAQDATIATSWPPAPARLDASWLGDRLVAPGPASPMLPDNSATEDDSGPRYSAKEANALLPPHWTITLQPTYERARGGGNTGYVLIKPELVFDVGLRLWTRVEWPVAWIDDVTGPTHAGIGDLTWLTLAVLVHSERWGKLGAGAVLVFPTASHTEMGQGKYQAGPALGWDNDAVPGWRFAFLLQQFFSFAGDTDRSRINQLSLQPIVTKLLPHAWYLKTQPTITVDLETGTSSVPLNLVIGKVLGGRWNVQVEANVYPDWTSRPSNDFKVLLSVGYLFPSPFVTR